MIYNNKAKVGKIKILFFKVISHGMEKIILLSTLAMLRLTFGNFRGIFPGIHHL